MGILRTLFALSVVLLHAGNIFGLNFVNGQLAVSSFYMISGFYMALILDKKYIKSNSSIWLFISNRFLRIYPVYYVTLAVTLFFIFIKYYFHIGTPDNLIDHYLAMTNFSPWYVVEIVNFIFRNMTLLLTIDYFLPTDSTGGYLIIQQAQTLQIELLFYLLAPFCCGVQAAGYRS